MCSRAFSCWVKSFKDLSLADASDSPDKLLLFIYSLLPIIF